jgi:hypothetical protein
MERNNISCVRAAASLNGSTKSQRCVSLAPHVGLFSQFRCRTRQHVLLCVYLVPAFAAVLCYLNGINGDFVHDDVYAIKDNPDVTGQAPLANVWRNDFWGKSMCDNTSHKSYRPLTVLSFR